MPKERPQPITDAVLCAEYEAVYRYVLALCRNEQEAQDVTQEAFLRAVRNKERFQGGSSLYTWLCAIAKNVYLNRLRKTKRETGPEALELVASDDLPVERMMEDRDLSLSIHRVLHELPEPYKEVFSLRVFGQLDYPAIAELFGKSQSWARVTFYRARSKIVEELRKKGIME